MYLKYLEFQYFVFWYFRYKCFKYIEKILNFQILYVQVAFLCSIWFSCCSTPPSHPDGSVRTDSQTLSVSRA